MPVYKKNNKWCFRTYIKDPNGVNKQYQRNGFATKTDAKNAEINFISNKENILETDITFLELYQVYIKDKKQKLKYQSIRSMEYRFKLHILPYFKDFKVKDINHNDYINWKENILKNNYSDKYNHSLHILMVGILNYAMSFYDLNYNVASKVGRFPKKQYLVEQDFWNYEEYCKFISVVNDIVYKSFFRTLYFTGIRSGEARALTWQDLDNNKIKIYKTISNRKINDKYVINAPKTPSSNRVIEIDNYTLNLLLELK